MHCKTILDIMIKAIYRFRYDLADTALPDIKQVSLHNWILQRSEGFLDLVDLVTSLCSSNNHSIFSPLTSPCRGI